VPERRASARVSAASAPPAPGAGTSAPRGGQGARASAGGRSVKVLLKRVTS
jgi:hypothetical protein